ncbi:hypothetical protein BJY00DRAFT_65103 [Aspergillus carlsbadensis]|nr:hypothetical protein BJY00DRAFT_65103 [Aspergillus carlsbadensis]
MAPSTPGILVPPIQNPPSHTARWSRCHLIAFPAAETLICLVLVSLAPSHSPSPPRGWHLRQITMTKATGSTMASIRL